MSSGLLCAAGLTACAIAAAPLCNAGFPSQAGGPATVFVDANIYTLDPDRPRAEALAIQDGRILAIGSRDEVLAGRGDDIETVALEGRTVLPGLIDAHCHMAGLGSFALGRLDLSATRSFDELLAAVAERAKAARPGEWILGGRWDHESWPDKRLPTHEKLSAITPNNPVWLTRVDGHAGLANAAAMSAANVSRETPHPEGGEIVRDARGEPTGLLVDNAMDRITPHIAGQVAGFADLVLKAQEICLSYGLTGVHDAGVSPAEATVYQRLAESGALKIRVYAMIHGAQAAEYFKTHGITVSPLVTVRAAKLYADGALGSRGAWLLAPYNDRPTDDAGRPYVGLAVTPPEEIRRMALDGLRRGYQVCTHAIGDRGNRETLDAYEAALASVAADVSAGQPPPQGADADAPRRAALGVVDHRFRIEHAQVLSPADIPRFSRLGVVASMQPTHCTSDMRWVVDRVGGERARGAYAWAALLRSGARIAAGSDFPVESANPMLGLHAAVTRQTVEGLPVGGWRPEQRLTREEALRACTLDAAYAAFQESELGSLSAGKLADFIVLDRDILTCDVSEIARARVLRTYVSGREVYRAEPAGSTPGP